MTANQEKSGINFPVCNVTRPWPRKNPQTDWVPMHLGNEMIRIISLSLSLLLYNCGWWHLTSTENFEEIRSLLYGVHLNFVVFEMFLWFLYKVYYVYIDHSTGSKLDYNYLIVWVQ